MVEIVIRCAEDPEKLTRPFLVPVDIKAKFYPWAFVLIFSLIFGVMLDCVAGILVGYLSKTYLGIWGYLGWTDIGDESIEKIERTFNFLKRIPNFIGCLESEVPVSLGTGGFKPFSGKGYRLD